MVPDSQHVVRVGATRLAQRRFAHRDHDDDDAPVHYSATEPKLRMPGRPHAAYVPGNRLDVIHEPDFDLLRGG